ncbi:hypothetical protein NMG60_11013912 [Bertholletia excelsa]
MFYLVSASHGHSSVQPRSRSNGLETLLRNHDLWRAELIAPVVSASRQSLRFWNQLLRFRRNVSSASVRRHSGKERGVCGPLVEREESASRSCCLGNEACPACKLITLIFIKFTGLIGFYVPMFGETEYNPARQYDSVDIEEQLVALGRAVDAGKIRYIGLSNETPYGVMKFLQVAEFGLGYPRIVSVQNSYNLLCRNFDYGMAECCHHERISLLAYSPLAMGILSGKYFSSDGGPLNARMNLFKGRYSEGESRYKLSSTIVREAARAYLDIAEKYGLHPVSLAIAFVLRHPLVSSAVFGVTKLWQLQEVLDACKVKLGPQIIGDIEKVHSKFPNPCP